MRSPPGLDGGFDCPLSNPQPLGDRCRRVALDDQFANPGIESGFLIVQLRQRAGIFGFGCLAFAFLTVLLRAAVFCAAIGLALFHPSQTPSAKTLSLFLFRPRGFEIEEQCNSWKRFSARKINQALSRRGRFGQEVSFDHLVRSPEQFEWMQRYIAENPVRAQLPQGEYLLWVRPRDKIA